MTTSVVTPAVRSNNGAPPDQSAQSEAAQILVLVEDLFASVDLANVAARSLIGRLYDAERAAQVDDRQVFGSEDKATLIRVRDRLGEIAHLAEKGKGKIKPPVAFDGLSAKLASRVLDAIAKCAGVIDTLPDPPKDAQGAQGQGQGVSNAATAATGGA